MAIRAYAGGAVIADVADLPDTDRMRVVALHGWGRDRHDLELATAGLPAARLDLPGFGSSPPPAEPWGADEYAALVATVLEGGGFATPLLVLGHSFGGRVAVCLAARRPDLVAGLVLCGVPLLRSSAPRRPPLALRVLKAAHRMGLVGDARLERWRATHGSRDYREASGVMRGVLVRAVNESYESQLRAITQPTVLVWGSQDAEVPLTIGQRARALLAGPSELVVVDGAGHDVHREAAGVVRDHLVAMMAGDTR